MVNLAGRCSSNERRITRAMIYPTVAQRSICAKRKSFAADPGRAETPGQSCCCCPLDGAFRRLPLRASSDGTATAQQSCETLGHAPSGAAIAVGVRRGGARSALASNYRSVMRGRQSPKREGEGGGKESEGEGERKRELRKIGFVLGASPARAHEYLQSWQG
jgi:hypothetical protein